MKEIKPIETWFDGYRFRSRTEARWAVFFKTAGIRCEYEKEGYALPAGWYLPDFFLPDLGRWLEVKGQEPTQHEMNLLCELLLATGKPVLLAVGAPEPRDQLIYIWAVRQNDFVGWDKSERYYWVDDGNDVGEFWLRSNAIGGVRGGGKSHPAITGNRHARFPGVHTATATAYSASRAERFERRG